MSEYRYEIQVYDDSPKLEDARNPSKKIMDIKVDCRFCSENDFLILCRKVRGIWPSNSMIELVASHTVPSARKIEWEE